MSLATIPERGIPVAKLAPVCAVCGESKLSCRVCDGPTCECPERLADRSGRHKHCDLDADPTCPSCESTNVKFESFDCGIDTDTGYDDSGVVGHCLDCGETADESDFRTVLSA